MIQRKEIRSKVFGLALAGGLGFWVANFAISLTPIAAEYRAALSIAYFPMLLEVFDWRPADRILRQLFPASLL